MKLPPFTLVYRGIASTKGAPKAKTLPDTPDATRLLTRLGAIKPELRQTLLQSVFPTNFVDDAAVLAGVPMLEPVVEDLTRQPNVVTVGIWDIGSRVGMLPHMIEQLNRAQPAFTFFEVHASVPAGMIRRPEGVVAWAAEALGRKLKKSEREEMEENVVDEDFFTRADRIRKDLAIDYLVGITPSMVAFDGDDKVCWNYFSSFGGRMVLASTYQLRAYARQAGRPFSAAVGAVVIAQLLQAMWPTRVEFHIETRGCLFDKNEDRGTIVTSLRTLTIERDCLRLIGPRYREAAVAMVDALKEYREEGSP